MRIILILYICCFRQKWSELEKDFLYCQILRFLRFFYFLWTLYHLLLLYFCEFWFSVDEVFVKNCNVSAFCNFRKQVENRKQKRAMEKKNFLILFSYKKYAYEIICISCKNSIIPSHKLHYVKVLYLVFIIIYNLYNIIENTHFSK